MVNYHSSEEFSTSPMKVWITWYTYLMVPFSKTPQYEWKKYIGIFLEKYNFCLKHAHKSATLNAQHYDSGGRNDVKYQF